MKAGGPLPHPSWRLSAEEAAEAWRSGAGWGCFPGVPTLSLNGQSQSPRASEPQAKITATREILGLLVPTNEGLRVWLPQRQQRKISRMGEREAQWMPLPMPKDEAETTRTPKNGSLFSAPQVHAPQGESGEQVGGAAPCLGPGPPLAAQPGRRSAPEPAGKWAPGRGAHLTGPCSWEIGCETCFKPPNHKNGRFSQPCSHVSQISRGVFSISIRETPGQPPAPEGRGNGARETWVPRKPLPPSPKALRSRQHGWKRGVWGRARPGPVGGKWKLGMEEGGAWEEFQSRTSSFPGWAGHVWWMEANWEDALGFERRSQWHPLVSFPQGQGCCTHGSRSFSLRAGDSRDAGSHQARG